MFYYLRANNDTVNAKLDALLAATQDGHGPHHQVDLSVYDKALYPPEDPKEVWEFNFERENKIPVDYFIEWFAAEYIPVSAPGLGVTKLSEEEQLLPAWRWLPPHQRHVPRRRQRRLVEPVRRLLRAARAQ